MEFQPRDGWLRLNGIPRALEEDELHKCDEFGDVAPLMQLRQLVATNDPIELVIRVLGPEVPCGINGVADAAPLQFKVRDLEPSVPLRREPQHRQPLLRRGLHIRRLQRRLRGRHQHQAVQAVLLECVLGRDQMPKMDGIETPAEKPDFHCAQRVWRQQRRQDSFTSQNTVGQKPHSDCQDLHSTLADPLIRSRVKTILAPVDFSGATDAVVAEAARLASAINGKVVLLSIIQPPVITSEYAPLMENMAEITAAGERAAGKQLASLQDALQAQNVPTETVQLNGAPIQHIVDQAKTLSADYIVMGSHGHTAIYDLLVGSTTHGVLLRSTCPVVIVPPQRGARDKGRK